ncbi:MAG TPA: hypothetical protein PK079_05705 [Leptospiraceae bacterium]|nr:hypothetical protein [Leptospiraceae bacterium]HMW05011.1 hypothetical protein [Leptospiraceae bacterium]HMX31455.1 hypothetical protein [Leptospiraceae bacterium]HMY33565.1 hypothetical protein [Leptospiraceae bacterium]HMZ62564.1 hypothetical protein [Leptospiraceae bacterium]
MQNAYVLTGSLKSPTLIELDESLSLSLQKVRITIEPLQSVFNKKSLLLSLKKIQAKQEKRNYTSPRKEDVDLYIAKLREDWN